MFLSQLVLEAQGGRLGEISDVSHQQEMGLFWRKSPNEEKVLLFGNPQILVTFDLA